MRHPLREGPGLWTRERTCYIPRMHVELSELLVAQLTERAKHLGVRPEALVEAAVADLVAHPAEDFEAIAKDVLARNAELYRRLA